MEHISIGLTWEKQGDFWPGRIIELYEKSFGLNENMLVYLNQNIFSFEYNIYHIKHKVGQITGIF